MKICEKIYVKCEIASNTGNRSNLGGPTPNHLGDPQKQSFLSQKINSHQKAETSCTNGRNGFVFNVGRLDFSRTVHPLNSGKHINIEHGHDICIVYRLSENDFHENNNNKSLPHRAHAFDRLDNSAFSNAESVLIPGGELA
jgi:hypothetical protein